MPSVATTGHIAHGFNVTDAGILGIPNRSLSCRALSPNQQQSQCCLQSLFCVRDTVSNVSKGSIANLCQPLLLALHVFHVAMQSMVWCNELVVLLAKLLQTLAQTDILQLHSQGVAQQYIVQQMQDATQPKLASALGWNQRNPHSSVLSGSDETQQQQPAPRVCPMQRSGMDSGKQVSDGQLLVINQQAGQQCNDR